MKNKTLRNDLIILGILVVLIGGLFLFKSKQQGAKIVIKRNDQIEGYYSLDDDQIINIDIENMQATAQCGVPLEVLENG